MDPPGHLQPPKIYCGVKLQRESRPTLESVKLPQKSGKNSKNVACGGPAMSQVTFNTHTGQNRSKASQKQPKNNPKSVVSDHALKNVRLRCYFREFILELPL